MALGSGHEAMYASNVTVFFGKRWSPSQKFFKEFVLDRFVQFSTLKNDFENQNFEMVKEVVHYFSKSDK